MSETTTIKLNCGNCGKPNECLYIIPFSCTYRAKGSTGISHLVTKRKAGRILGKCESCGYEYKKSDLND